MADFIFPQSTWQCLAHHLVNDWLSVKKYLRENTLLLSANRVCVCIWVGEHTLMLLSQERDTYTKYHIHYYLCGKFLFFNKLNQIHVSQGSNVNELKASI